jgi:AcrR family transcriptional regulator
MMIAEVESVALELFERSGFEGVTVEEIATTAQISPRTFYRYFPAKEDVLQVRIDRWAAALREALATRPVGEPALRSLRFALVTVASADDAVLRRRWITIVVATPNVLQGVIGGIQLKSQHVTADFLGDRLGLPTDALVPTMLAAAVGGVIQAAHTRWLLEGGDFPTILSDGMEVLESGIGS